MCDCHLPSISIDRSFSFEAAKHPRLSTPQSTKHKAKMADDELVVHAHRHMDGTFLCNLNLSKQQLAKLRQSPPTSSNTTKTSSSTNSSGTSVASSSRPPFVVVLDRSGSMHGEVKRIVTKLLPDILERLSYTWATVIAFDTTTAVMPEMTVERMRVSPLRAQGCTNFKPATMALLDVLRQSKDQRIRVLTISDGMMSDRDAAAIYASQHAADVKQGRVINSKAIRYFTSSQQPDTRGLSAVLQFNTGGTASLIDFDARTGSNSDFVDMVVGLFQDDGMDATMELQCDDGSPIFKRMPWDEPQASMLLTLPSSDQHKKPKQKKSKQPQAHAADEGNDGDVAYTCSFWLSALPSASAPLRIAASADTRVVIKEADPITPDTFDRWMAPVIDQAMAHIRVLKVLDTTQAQQEVQTIAAYFDQLQSTLTAIATRKQQQQEEEEAAAQAANGASTTTTATTASSPSTMMRLRQLKRQIEQRKKSLVNRLLELANDERVSQLNAAQQAAYLRETDASKNARGLARRAAKGPTGDEMTRAVREEIAAIASSIHELDAVDDSTHAVSFISQETTVGALRDLAAFFKADGDGDGDDDDDGSGVLHEMAVPELLRAVGIVGMACKGQVGDYPDPMTWRVDNIYPGCFITVADMTEHELFAAANSGGSGIGGSPLGDAARLRVPGGVDQETSFITNVIPVFEDVRVHHFLRRHAATLLELISGVGMRRMIAVVPMTHAFTLAAGTWACVDALAAAPSPAERPEVLVRACTATLRDLDIAFGKYFQHVFPFLQRPDTQPQDRSFYLCNNGLTNMLTVLYRAERLKWPYPRPRVLRAIYNYECYQFTKKAIAKHLDARQEFIDGTLHALFNLDYDRDCCAVGAPFEDTPAFACAYAVGAPDAATLGPFARTFRFVEGMVLLPPLMKLVVDHHHHHQQQQQQQQQHSGDGGMAALVDAVRSLPHVDEAFKHTSFGLAADLPLDVFRAVQLAQGLLCPRKDLRVDDEAELMRLPDVHDRAGAAAYVLEQVVLPLYEREYNRRVDAKRAAEEAEAVAALVDALVQCESEDAFVAIMQDGYTHRGTHVRMDNPSSAGVDALMAGLAAEEKSVPCRLRKIELLVLAVREKNSSDATSSDGADVEVVWNRGNVLRLDLSVFAAVYVRAGEVAAWAAIKAEHKKRAIHLYREAANRHGHSNALPSYWALGYATLDAMRAAVSAEEYQEYCSKHTRCCGFA
ncbi:hypothetical protein PTSG_03387 [Salpingoeca rosetta]|uniref:VWFA domain-containing protein n=1 Tax=Salpingoeca rosetta (strain ATCC 50818 / BSB-021) TaxID=946362 RepID=F2U521_SALR5|nr:uncharacterized protein PTSG_03387 [Salpingoeca rosetta]EGD82737.1 hypothetical protein PTSG_03387 [Salpingoeca rosetta]|eukprot:XP_004995973.1 hypothetical protein PTSG_03387 [Salpingoeca rosetta]